MPSPFRCAFCLAALLPLTLAFAAPASQSTDSRDKYGRATLPDPDLLDGSKFKPEARSDYGMLGEFDLPGSDQQSDKAGQTQSDQTGAGGNADDKTASDQKGGGQSDADQKSDKGGGSQAAADQQNQNGGSGSEQTADASSQGGGGGPPDGKQSANSRGGGGGRGGQSDPNAQAGGMQVAEIDSGDSSGDSGPGGAGGSGDKPPAVAFGDKAMKIDPAAASAGVVGTAVAPSGTQASEANGVGTGRPGTVPSNNGGGRHGTEKGQTMPQGL